MTTVIIMVTSQLLTATCLAMYNEYIALAYAISVLSTYALASVKYFDTKDKIKSFEKQIKEALNEHNNSTSDDDNSSTDSKS